MLLQDLKSISVCRRGAPMLSVYSLLEEGLVRVAKMKRWQKPSFQKMTGNAEVFKTLVPLIRRPVPPIVELREVCE